MSAPAECIHGIWQQVVRPQTQVHVQVLKPQVRVKVQVLRPQVFKYKYKYFKLVLQK